MIRAAVEFARAVASTALDRAVSSVIFDRAKILTVELGNFVRFLATLFSDSASASDNQAIDSQKSLTNNFSLSDQNKINAIKVLSDLSVISESSALEIIK